ncbi:MAG: NAD(P)-dependent oxidoreductase [Caldilineaceae bacterium]
MTNLIVVHGDFETHWPFVADDLLQSWQAQSETTLVRLPQTERRPLGELIGDGSQVTRLVALGVPVTAACLTALPRLSEAAFLALYGQTQLSEEVQTLLKTRGVTCYSQRSEGFWGQSVAEFALALTLCALRQIPQNYHAMLTTHEPWLRYQPARNQGPGTVGAQYSDDSRFTNGTLAGKRVRIVGAGNIGSRYASFAHMLGADVASWDPFASEPAFHRAGARREHHLSRLVKDAEIFAPMLPLKADTRGLVTADLINDLPQGCLVILATRALICDMAALRRRVLDDELALAADVFDVEPMPLDDPLLGRANVVHTPHLAGRTRDANRQWALALLAQFTLA